MNRRIFMETTNAIISSPFLWESTRKSLLASRIYEAGDELQPGPDVSEGAEVILSKRKTINAVEELAERGLVEIEGRAIGFIQIKLAPRGIDHFEAPPSPPVSQNINIGTIAGSAIVGSQTHATLNVGATLTDVSALISELPGIQKAIGEDLLQELKGMESGEKEIKKGALSKFSDLLAKHSDLSTAVLEFIGKLLVGA